jgi:hypothetical protein
MCCLHFFALRHFARSPAQLCTLTDLRLEILVDRIGRVPLPSGHVGDPPPATRFSWTLQTKNRSSMR